MKDQSAQQDCTDDAPFGCLSGVHMWLPLSIGVWLVLGIVGYFFR